MNALQPVSAPEVKAPQNVDAESAPRLVIGGVGGNAVRGVVRLVSKRRILVAIVITLFLLLGVLVTLITTPTYRSTAILEISREAASLAAVSKEASQAPSTVDQEFYETQYGLLRGPALAREVVRALNLHNDSSFMGGPVPEGASGAAELENRERIAAAKIQENTSVVPARMSRLVEIRYEDPDPARSAQVANTFAERYIQSNLSRRLDRNTYARDFLGRRIEEVRQKLEDAERRLVTYAGQQRIISVPSTEAQQQGAQGTASQSLAGSNLAGISEALIEARAARATAQGRWEAAQQAGAGNRLEALQNPALNALLQRRAEVEAQVAQLRSRYRDDQPDLAGARQQSAELTKQISLLQRQVLASVRSEFDAASRRENDLQRQVEAQTGQMMDLSRRSIQYNILQRDVDSNRTLYEGLLRRAAELGVENDVGSNNVSVVLKAETPTKPFQPKPMRNMLIALFAGCLAGLAAALLAETLDASASTPEDLKERLGEPVIGVVPALQGTADPIETLGQAKSALSEAYLSIHANLMFATPNGAPRSIAVTSTRAGEGKTTSSIALAAAFARQGERVLLIDGDLRRPSLHKRLQLENRSGLSSLLSGQSALPQVVQHWADGRVDIVTSGPLPPSPAELIGGPLFARTIREAEATYDRIIVDAPPVLGLADAPLISTAVASVLFVVEAGVPRVNAIRRSMARIRELRGNIVGVIFAKFNMRRSMSEEYGYYGYYSYGSDEKSGRS